MSPEELEKSAKNLREGVMGYEKEGSGESSDEDDNLASEHRMSRSEALTALIKSKGKTLLKGENPTDATTHKHKRPRLTRCGSFFDSDSDSDVGMETRHGPHNVVDIERTSPGSNDQSQNRTSNASSSENRPSDVQKRKRVRQLDESSESESESQSNRVPSQREDVKPLKKNRKLMFDSDSDDGLVMDLTEHSLFNDKHEEEGSIRSPPVNTLDVSDRVNEGVWFDNDQAVVEPGSMGSLVVSETLAS